MALCQRCKSNFRTPEGEEEDHECPHCGWAPGQDATPRKSRLPVTETVEHVGLPRLRLEYDLLFEPTDDAEPFGMLTDVWSTALSVDHGNGYGGRPLNGNVRRLIESDVLRRSRYGGGPMGRVTAAEIVRRLRMEEEAGRHATP